MKIFYDHLCFWQKYGGVPRYFVELLKRIPSSDYILSVKYSNNEYLKELEKFSCKSFFPNFNFRGKPKLENLIGKPFSIAKILNGDFDIYHQTHYDCYAYKYLPKSVRKITTIHDMNFFTIPEFYSKNPRTKLNQIKSGLKADHIITISENSKNDICNYWNVAKENISVIYHGVDKEYISHIKPVYRERPYIYYVGSRNAYKNFQLFVRAFSYLHAKYPDLILVCAGNPPSSSELMLLNSLHIENHVEFIQASDEELIGLYKSAEMFVFPSFYEGFGLPILESMAAQCPIVLSNTSCFPEIAKDAGLYFSPNNIDDIYDKMLQVIQNPSLRSALISRGNIRVQEFSWEKCVNEHIKTYNLLL